jgi:glyoxylase-like metal-dependent hydrolase (beta-lactamase superfamily II)
MKKIQSKHFGQKRCFLLALNILAVSIIWLTPPQIFAQADSPVTKINEAAAKADITVEGLRGNISVLMGSGGNITVFTGPNGKLLVDAGIAVSQTKIQAALDGISSAPLKYVVNTHWHWDHADGNEWAHKAGATIIAQENVLKRLSNTERVEDWNYTFQPVAAGGRPTVTFKTDKTLKFNGETIVMKNYGLGHTDGDTSVYFRKADVLALGDIFWNGHYPFIDNAHGGGINDTIRWVNESINRATDKTLIVPGHGPVGSRAQLVEYRDMLVGIRENVARLKKQRKSLAEIIADKPTAAYDAKFGGFLIDSVFFTCLVYTGV